MNMSGAADRVGETAEGREDKARLTEQALAMSTRLEECYYNF